MDIHDPRAQATQCQDVPIYAVAKEKVGGWSAYLILLWSLIRYEINYYMEGVYSQL